MIDLAPEYLTEIKRILGEYAPECDALAYGSRVSGTARKYSDLDVALVGSGRLDWRMVERIKDAFSESALPIIVDVLDWHAINDGFRKAILIDHETLQQTQKHISPAPTN